MWLGSRWIGLVMTSHSIVLPSPAPCHKPSYFSHSLLCVSHMLTPSPIDVAFMICFYDLTPPPCLNLFFWKLLERARRFGLYTPYSVYWTTTMSATTVHSTGAFVLFLLLSCCLKNPVFCQRHKQTNKNESMSHGAMFTLKLIGQ